MNSEQWIIGVDEVGRGPLAGPVVAAAVLVNLNAPIDGLKDSKQLSEKKREQFYLTIPAQVEAYAIVECSPETIDEINILQASLKAMKEAVESIQRPGVEIWVDGNQLPKGLDYPAQAIIKGDTTHWPIQAASILAKVYRDHLMVAYSKQYPGYDFDKHKGYPTKAHMQALNTHGITPIHRRSFAPVRKLMMAADAWQ